MKTGARSPAGRTRVRAFKPHWSDDVAVLLGPPWFLVIAFLAASSDWARAALIAGTVFLMMDARARSAAMGCARAAVA